MIEEIAQSADAMKAGSVQTVLGSAKDTHRAWALSHEGRIRQFLPMMRGVKTVQPARRSMEGAAELCK